jgi:hypothetical protein
MRDNLDRILTLKSVAKEGFKNSRLIDFKKNIGVDIKEKALKEVVDCRYIALPEDKKHKEVSLFWKGIK